MKVSDKAIQKTFVDNPLDVEIVYENIENQNVRLVIGEGSEEDSTLVVFVHGAPGGWDAWKKYMLDEDFHFQKIIAFDRPGYGYSTKASMTSIEEQTTIVEKIIEKYRLPKTILVGHSYGGPIVANILMRRPDLVSTSIMIAAVNDPDNEPLKWYSYFAYWKLTKWMLPHGFQVAGDEKFAHATALDEIRNGWKAMPKRITHIHGDNDGLAPSDHNIAWSKKNIPSDKLNLVVMNGGHLILWRDYDKIKKVILNEIERL